MSTTMQSRTPCRHAAPSKFRCAPPLVPVAPCAHPAVVEASRSSRSGRPVSGRQSRLACQVVVASVAEPATQVAYASSRGAPVAADIEKTSWTSRKVYASVQVEAPVSVVWGCLTDYEGLGTFIPSLVENTCLERKRNGAVLRQVGKQEVAMGVNFAAACVLDCTEYAQGVPTDLCCTTSAEGPDHQYPYPKQSQPGVRSKDITFRQLDGDFQAFRGIWRMQPARGSISSKSESTRTLLCYSLFVKPKAWLPVGLIQNRIEKEVVRNLEAVRQHAEQLYRASCISQSSDNEEEGGSGTSAGSSSGTATM